MEEPEGCCFDDWVEYDAKRARKRRVQGVSADLADLLERAGLSGRTVLDVGCGVGGLAIEAVSRGAAAATGIDLSSKAVEEARRLSSENGTSDHTTFEVGDGSTARLDRHDVVVLNRVFCCYGDVDALLANSLAAARSVYAFSVPPSRGLRGLAARLSVRVGNWWRRLRPSKFQGFQAYVHDVGAIDAGARAAGFEPLLAGRRFAWDLAVYSR